MADWGPVFVGVVLFIILQPGLLFTIPGKHSVIEFGNSNTSGKAIFFHAVFFFAIYAILIVAVHVHVYTG